MRRIAAAVTCVVAVGIAGAPAASARTASAGGQPQDPGPPTQIVATPGDGQVSVSFTPPERTGDSPIESYTVWTRDSTGSGSTMTTGPTSPVVVEGLNNGDLYYFQVTAMNVNGNSSLPSPAENAAIPTSTPQLAPLPPTNATATAGDERAVVSYEPPSIGDDEIAYYQATAVDLDNPPYGGQSAATATGRPDPITITGLTNGDRYAFSVVAVTVTNSPPSALSAPVTPAGPPDPPTITKVTPGNGQATVTLSPPANDGGSPVLRYHVRALDETDPLRGNPEAEGTESPITVPELVNGNTYSFEAYAISAAGESQHSQRTGPVTLPIGPGQPPGPPTNVVAKAGDGSATVTFTPPEETGSDPITSYTVYAQNQVGGSPAQAQGFGDESPVTITGLTNGDFWVIAVAANNDAGTGPAAPAENPVIPTSDPSIVPDPPTSVTATAGDAQAIVSYEAPRRVPDGLQITGYVATAVDLTTPTNGGQNAFSPANDPAATPITVLGLTNGDVYVFSVVTLTAPAPDGGGPAIFPASGPSKLSGPVIPNAPPGAPEIGKATPGNGEINVTFRPPRDDGGAAVVDYTVRADDETDPSRGVTTATGADSPIKVDGLVNGHAYSLTVVARNEGGVGPPSGREGPVTPDGPAPTAPGPPTDVRADAGEGQATVRWDAPKDTGHSPVVGYTVTAFDQTNPGSGGQSVAAAGTSATVKGLTAGDRYVFRVSATNAIGTGPQSDPSDPVVPKGPDRQDEPKQDEPKQDEPTTTPVAGDLVRSANPVVAGIW